MIFLTVGTEYPLDRLVRPIDALVGSGKLTDEVFAQIGIGGYRPRHLRWAEMLTQDQFDHHLNECRAVVSHAGMGTIIRCIEIGKPLLVMPRLKALSEHVNDHQRGTAERFAERGDILLANDTSEITARISDLSHFSPRSNSSNRELLLDHIGKFLCDLEH